MRGAKNDGIRRVEFGEAGLGFCSRNQADLGSRFAGALGHMLGLALSVAEAAVINNRSSFHLLLQ